METDNIYNHNETELLEHLAQNKEPAFNYVYHQYYKPLFFYARRFVEVQPAEDILSECFLRFYKSDKRFESLSHIRNWLRMAVHNGCLNLLRNEHKRHLKETALNADEIENEKELFAAEIEVNLFARILAAIQQLPARQRNILQLCYVQGKDNAEAANILGISLQSLKNQKVTALKSLRTRFGKQDLLLFGCAISFHSFLHS